MRHSELVSVVIACYNDADFIEEAIESVRSQTYNKIELIVVDDGSDQNTKNVLSCIDGRIDLLLTQENSGVSSARNLGIENAKGELIFILDSDDYIEPTLIEKLANLMLNSQNVKIASCWALRFSKSRKNEILQLSGGESKDFLITNQALGTAMYRKSDLLEIGGYDVSMKEGFEDWELHINLLKKGGRAVVLEEPLYNYRITGNSRNEQAKKNPYPIIKYIYQKHEDLFIEYLDIGLERIFFKIQKEQNAKFKVFNSAEYRLGKFLLSPFRLIQNVFFKK